MAKPKKTEQPPAFLLDVDDWLTSARIAAMTADEERAYFRLLMYQWKDPDCTLPDDDLLLAAMAKAPLDLWLNQIRRVVEICFRPNGKDGSTTPPESGRRWCNLRLLEERTRWRAWKEKSRTGGLKSAETRKNKQHGTKRQLKANHSSTKHQPMANETSSNNIPPHEEISPVVGSNQKENNNNNNRVVVVENLSVFSEDDCHAYAESLVGNGITNPGGFAVTIRRDGTHDRAIKEFLAKSKNRRIQTPTTRLP